METSAKTGVNVELAFIAVAKYVPLTLQLFADVLFSEKGVVPTYLHIFHVFTFPHWICWIKLKFK